MAELEAAFRSDFELAERRDWESYALGRPVDATLLEGRSALGALFADGELPALLEHWSQRVGRRRALELRLLARHGARLAIDVDAEVVAAAERADRLEDEGAAAESLADTLVALFARRELLARRAGYRGYVDLGLAAEGLSPAAVETELARIEETSRRGGDEDASEAVGSAVPVVPDPAELWERATTLFAPLLEGVELRLERTIRVAGFCKIVRWPDDVRIAVRGGREAEPADRLRLFALLAHELGHALHFRLLGELGIAFPALAARSALEQETFADLAERLAFESDLGGVLGLSEGARRLWRKRRKESLRLQLGRARFESKAYAAALDAPTSLEALWDRQLDETGTSARPRTWAEDGHGFYTEDPLRRLAYPLAFARSQDLLVSSGRPITADRVVRTLRRHIQATAGRGRVRGEH